MGSEPGVWVLEHLLLPALAICLHSLCLIGLASHRVSVLDSCDDELKSGQEADRIG